MFLALFYARIKHTKMTYNLTLILKSDLKDADRKKEVTKIKDSFGKAKVKENDWGQKPLAYPIEKQVSGYFVNMVVGEGFELCGKHLLSSWHNNRYRGCRSARSLARQWARGLRFDK